MKYIDTHAHITSKYFKESTEEALELAKQNNVVYILAPGTSIEDSRSNLELANSNDMVLAGLGIHPSDVTEDQLKELEKISPDGYTFIGETGIDLYHDNNPPLELQIKSFRKHLDIAKATNMSIEIHARDSFEEVYEIISEDQYKGIKFIMHSFTGNVEWAKKFISLGAKISFSGIVTFKNAKDLQKVAKTIDVKDMVVETDSPFLAPSPHRGKQNTPGYVKHVADFIAELRGEEIQEQIFNNTIKVFNID